MTILLLVALLQDRVLPEGRKPADVRLEKLKDLDGSFPFEVPATKEAWEARAAELKLRTRVALGLWPEPERTPLNSRIWGKVERPDFTVEKVAFESVPGLFVTGLLYRPKTKGPHAAVLSPHGHEGRLWDYGDKGVRRMIADGAERFERSGRWPQLARCATLARLGCVVFIHDMLGYADSTQIPTSVAHRFSKPRPDMETAARWGFYSPQAENRLQSILGVQAWSCVRALDFLCSLPDVDPSRLGVTGSSGGGTQTILTCALDARPAVAFPQGMVSTSMQGGCTCENACYLRIGTGNVELAALFAPKPQGMTAANDWTKEMMTKGFPELEKLYGMLGAKGNVLCKNHVHFPHNYNAVSRALMYGLFNKHLKLGHEEPILEEDFEPLSPAEFTVWDAEHPAPPSGEDVEAALLKSMAEASDRRMTPDAVAKGLEVLIGRGLPAYVERVKVEKIDQGDRWLFKDLLRHKGEELPLLTLHPKNPKGKVAIWADGEGKSAIFGPLPRKLVEAGWSVLGVDVLYQGEFGDVKVQPKVANTRAYAGFTYGYNAPLFAKRVHDLLTVIAYVRSDKDAPKELTLIGADGAGPWAAAASARAGDVVSRAVVDTGGFRFAALTSYLDPDFLPGAVKYGDLPAILALSGPRLWVAGEKAAPAGATLVPGVAEAVDLLLK
ncbi:MAG TPA: acetylxylan esterase [Planctomycetota bacterium]